MNYYVGNLPNIEIIDILKRNFNKDNQELILIIKDYFIDLNKNKIVQNSQSNVPIKFIKLEEEPKNKKLNIENFEYDLFIVKEDSLNKFYIIDLEFEIKDIIIFFKNLLLNLNDLDNNYIHYLINNTLILNSKQSEINDIIDKLGLDNNKEEIKWEDNLKQSLKPFYGNNLGKIPIYNKEKDIFNYSELI